MNKILLIAITSIIFSIKVNSQILDVPQVIQEKDQWCWVGVSKCVLDFYGFTKQQCEIAEYARSVITWYNFGSVNCCVNADAGCNYWNYNWGRTGSIEDILTHFGSVTTQNFSRSLTTQEITAQMELGYPFIFRWGWKSGGGHFLVGHGISGQNIYYMDPWFNSGHKIADYQWVVENTSHTWTHTQYSIPPATSSIQRLEKIENIKIYPNPTISSISIHADENEFGNCSVIISTIDGKVMIEKEFQTISNHLNETIDVSSFTRGVYIVKIKSSNFERFGRFIIQ